MEADSDRNSPPLEYTQHDWGDLIFGTKEQLQALGLGVGLAYPGDPAGPKRRLTTTDPRGYSVTIANLYHTDGRFTVRVNFPDWPAEPDDEVVIADAYPGVSKRESYWHDEYIGTAASLAACGLIRLEHMPGMPGMRKTRVRVNADGTLPAGAPNANDKRAKEGSGAKTIERASKSHYSVCVALSAQEQQRRSKAREVAQEAWRSVVRALPRPAKLTGPSPEETTRARESLAAMPQSADSFRADVIDVLRQDMAVVLEDSVSKSSQHGYTLDEDALTEIHAAFDSIAESIAAARVCFDKRLHDDIAQVHRHTIASADWRFRTKMHSFLKPDARLLEGVAP